MDLITEVDTVQNLLRARNKLVDPNIIYMKLEAYLPQEDRVERVVNEVMRENKDEPDIIDLTNSQDEWSDGSNTPKVGMSVPELFMEFDNDSTVVSAEIPDCSKIDQSGEPSSITTVPLNDLYSTEVVTSTSSESNSDQIMPKILYEGASCSKMPDEVKPTTSRSRIVNVPATPIVPDDSAVLPQTNDLNNNSDKVKFQSLIDFWSNYSYEEGMAEAVDLYEKQEQPLNIILDYHEKERRTLLREAKVIHNTVSERSLEEIYAYLEANRDNEDRLQVVLEMFQNPDSELSEKTTEEEQTNQQVEYVEVYNIDSTAPKAKSPGPIPPKEKLLLLEMFPDMQPEHLDTLPYDSDPGWMNATVSALLAQDYPKRVVEIVVDEPERPITPERLSEIIEIQLQNLTAILPNADPTYLRNRCELLAGNEQAIKEFVSDALEHPDYPTIADYRKRMEVVALQKKYTEQFKLEEFLEIFPDPNNYFMNEKVSNKSTNLLGMSYLKKRYSRLRISDIQVTYYNTECNLTQTCKILDKSNKFMKCRRKDYDANGPTSVNIPFLQEVAYIENQKTITEYLQAKADVKKEAFEKAKAEGTLKECACCYDAEVLLDDMLTCDGGHLFCKDCIRRGVEVQIGEGKTSFPCFVECGAEFSLKTLQGTLKPAVFSRLLHRKQIEEVKAASIPGLETCPFCDFATIPDNNDKVFHCLNPECMKDSCRSCKQPNHIPLRCNEVEQEAETKMRTYIEDKMTEALVRTCWSCKSKFIKEDGCNKMKCKCGALMCYICRQPVKSYDHFNPNGGTDYEKCPLFSSNEDLHVNAVKKEGEKARVEVLNSNPGLNLKHDPTKNLPNAPKEKSIPNQRGPRPAHPVGGLLEHIRHGQVLFQQAIAHVRNPPGNEHLHREVIHHHHHHHYPMDLPVPAFQVQPGIIFPKLRGRKRRHHRHTQPILPHPHVPVHLPPPPPPRILPPVIARPRLHILIPKELQLPPK